MRARPSWLRPSWPGSWQVGSSRGRPGGSGPRALAVLAAGLLGAGLLACQGENQPPGTIEGERLPQAAVAARAEAEREAEAALEDRSGAGPRALPERQILFGDLHVHTTYSIDAFLFSLPIFAGEGSHPPADACDFARYCSAVDFFAYTDHAESLVPETWEAEKQAARQCNALAGDPEDPDLVAFMGFEWTQVGRTPETHWGHKCVIFPGLADDELPTRPINSLPDTIDQSLFAGIGRVADLRFFDPTGWREYLDFRWLAEAVAGLERCPAGVDSRELPPDCAESAPTPDVLFEKLAQQGVETMVIPHGTTWGLYTPAGTTMDKQLTRQYHDPAMQPLIEIMSGHGNSEEFRAWREWELDADGNKVCPEPTPDYLPCCWQAGEIMRSRCDQLPADECQRRVERARQLYLKADVAGNLVFPDASAEDWLDCGQCRDCFKPSLGYRPRESVQYTLALSNPDEAGADGEPLRFRYGFVASSDNHTARPGTGYKQYARREMTESTGPRSAFYDRVLRRARNIDGFEHQVPFDVPEDITGLIGADAERVASFLYPGGLVAVHSEGRSREAIWDALERKEVYGTSGPRILLWFDLLNGPEGMAPMGSEVRLAGSPQFEVRAVGSFVQKPGCPEVSVRGLSAERLERLCRGECYNPGDERHPIVAIEVVRIRPQRTRDEPVAPLIEDPWLRFECPPDPTGCTVRFEDPEFAASGRDVVYYARALQEETPAVNGDNLRTRFDAEGNAVATDPCYGDYRTPFDDDCLAPVQERAWSSPIFVDQPGPLGTPTASLGPAGR